MNSIDLDSSTETVSRRIVMTRILLFVLLLFGFSSGADEARIVTLDGNGRRHSRDTELLDVSPNGKWILFGAKEQGDDAFGAGLYRYRVASGHLMRINDPSLENHTPESASISDDGNYVAWQGSGKIYWRDLAEERAKLVTKPQNLCARPIISRDGRLVVFLLARSIVEENPLIPASQETATVCIYDSVEDTSRNASLAHDGSILTSGVGHSTNDLNCFDFDRNGKYIAFNTSSTNAHPDLSQVAGIAMCVYRRDLETGEVLLLNRNATGEVAWGTFTSPKITSSGHMVAFRGSGVGIGGRQGMGFSEGLQPNVYVKDVSTANVWLATPALDSSPIQGGVRDRFLLRDDGKMVVFASGSDDLVDYETDPGGVISHEFDLFRSELKNDGNTLVTMLSSGPDFTRNIGVIDYPLMPADGSFVVFSTLQHASMIGEIEETPSAIHGVAVGAFPEPEAVTYEEWASDLAESHREPDAAPFGNGVPNAIRYLMGIASADSERNQLPRMGVQSGASLGLGGDDRPYLTLSLRIRRDLPPGVVWKVRAGDDLESLGSDAGSAIQVGEPVRDGYFDVYRFRHPSPMTEGRGFLDVSVEVD